VSWPSLYMTCVILESPSAETRLARAAAWLAERSEVRVTIIGATLEAAAEVARRALELTARKASLGWERTTLGVHAASLARPELARLGLVPVSGLAFEALAARVVHDERERLERLRPIVGTPGLPRALARTILELRLAGSPALPDRDLVHLGAAFERTLEAAGLADRARMFELATAKASTAQPCALLFVDVVLRYQMERDFVAALVTLAPATLATVAAGDARTLALTRSALHVTENETHIPGPTTALSRLQAGLFGKEQAPSPAGKDEIAVLSAPGESRECVEIARVVLREAEAGTPFDRMAILLRAPQYGPHLEEAFRRARIPAFFARGTQRPAPAGRALLALLSCAAEGLSARRFAEYLSLGEVPVPTIDGAPPPATPAGERVAVPDDDAFLGLLAKSASDVAASQKLPDTAAPDESDQRAADGTLPVPRHWEKLLVDAAVIGGKDRWVRRLDGLQKKLEHDKIAYEKEDDMARVAGTQRDLAALDALRQFALPLVHDLAALPRTANWGTWIDALENLATRAIKQPDRILSVLRELVPMAVVGDVEIAEVLAVLEPRISQVVVPPTGRRYGKVFVARVEEARGLSFDVVCIPGLAEKLFPQKVVEDPLLLDEMRLSLDAELPTMKERADDERLALRIAVGAASRRVVFSYPRLDLEQARPRTPSFYGLEVLRVAEGGELKDFEHLAQRAAVQASARLGWPAPVSPESAIDDAEHDLAVLDSIRGKSDEESKGAAHYLLNANAHLARSLRFRGRRWLRAWKQCDGLVDPPPEALAAIIEHTLDKRAFSPTALQHYSVCPYRFLLSAVHKLEPRDEPTPIETLDPLTRGSLVHEVQFALLTELRDEGMLPVSESNIQSIERLLDATLERVASRYHDELAPAIERVWDDAIRGIAADVREWLRRMTASQEWTPVFFELSFGLGETRTEDKHSQKDPLDLSVGIRFRGSLDLVERDAGGALRAVDYKTGKVKAKENIVIAGGAILQPALYALALEKHFPETPIDSGILYYCTSAAEFTMRRVPLDDDAREAVRAVAQTVGASLREGFLPAAPARDACAYCDYRTVCGPHEEIRVMKKPQTRLRSLLQLRSRP
jgi:ATP-dependent helicase/nuclease subunit B